MAIMPHIDESLVVVPELQEAPIHLLVDDGRTYAGFREPCTHCASRGAPALRTLRCRSGLAVHICDQLHFRRVTPPDQLPPAAAAAAAPVLDRDWERMLEVLPGVHSVLFPPRRLGDGASAAARSARPFYAANEQDEAQSQP